MQLLKATVRGYDGAAHEATVQVVGSLGLYLAAVKVARNVAGADVIAGRLAAIVLFDEHDARDGVLVAVYDG